ncbi:MAG: EamA family transporter [Actinobacteria bacterium]|nr:MAG: EamA family transporter [Actinomycetota bacterium]
MCQRVSLLYIMSAMVIIWALSAALMYGVADYFGGRATKVSKAAAVTFLGQSTALVLIAALIMFGDTPVMSTNDWLWSGFAGGGGAIALVAFYQSMSLGSMTVVAPISAIVGMCSPVVVGLLQGERPAPVAYLGMLLAVVAVALVGDVLDHHDLPTPLRAIVYAVISGLGFGVIFVCLAQTSPDAGLWPLLGQRLVSVPTVAVVGLLGVGRLKVDRRVIALAMLSGVLDTTANGLYLLAIHGGLLSLVGVITALYPVSTVGLAITVDHEKLHKSQIVGLVLAAASLAMVGYASNA